MLVVMIVAGLIFGGHRFGFVVGKAEFGRGEEPK